MTELRGRIVNIRDHGNLLFLDLKRQDNLQQLSIKKKTLKSEFTNVKSTVSVGDIIQIRGEFFVTRQGTKTLDVTECTILTKCYLPTMVGSNPGDEMRRQNRGFDLLTNTQSIRKFNKINKFSQIVRTFLYKEGFSEVNTGLLQKTTDTSKSRSFVTKPNWDDKNLFLRKSTEQKLKQLMVGGLEDIFELGTVFRNESIGRKFLPEFTVLELYKSYGNYEDILTLIENMLEKLDEEIGVPVSQPSNYKKINFYDFMNEHAGLDVRTASLKDITNLLPTDKQKDYPPKDEARGYLLNDLFDVFIRTEKQRNIAIIGYPIEISILAKTIADEPTLAEEFRLFIKGRSFCYGCTELTDFNEQQERIKKQAKFWNKQEDNLDPAFINLLQVGLPPCAGLGLSLQRLQSIYLDIKDVRDVVLFPL